MAVRAGSRRRPGLLAVLAAGATAILLLVWLAPVHRELDLAASAAADHARFVTEVAEEGLPPATLEELGTIVRSVPGVAPPVPPALPAGYRLLKVGRCSLDGAPVAYLVVSRGTEPVSLFLMSRGSLNNFPRASARLAREPGGVACRVHDFEFLLAGAPDRLTCGIGKLGPAELRRLVSWLLGV